jgi:poly(3-hydroxybutyrate) depolymerase
MPRAIARVLVLLVFSAPAALGGTSFRRGDSNVDGEVDISDAVKALRILYLGEEATCADAVDADDDGVLGLGDPVAVLEHLFAGAAALRAPYPSCGPDPTPDAFACAFPAGCSGGEQGVQASGSLYRIDLPAPEAYNRRLVIWAHGFQTAGTPVGIPEDQMRFGDIYLPDLVTQMGFAFATNSYSKTGLAVRQGVADILDLVDIFVAGYGRPDKVYVTGASEGGLITALLIEGHPEVFAAGLAACGPVGDFEFQIGYFGDVLVLFDHFFSGLIPGDPLEPTPELIAGWGARYGSTIRPALLAPANRGKLEDLAATADLPVDPADFLSTADTCVGDALSYCILDMVDAEATLGGFPYENREKVYSGSDDDEALNQAVVRVAADPAAVEEMRAHYDTTGLLAKPLVTIHTTLDPQVPYEHEVLYEAKCQAAGTTDLHRNFTVTRFGHCLFERDELLLAFAALLQMAGDLEEMGGVGGMLEGESLAAFEEKARAAGIPYRVDGPPRVTFRPDR